MSKTALITGAYRGLGFETARQLLGKGYEVIITSRKLAAGETASDKLRQETKGTVHFVAMDVTDEKSVETAAAEVRGLIDHLNILINNAAIFPDPSKNILDTPTDMLSDTYLTNTIGPILVTRAFESLLKKAKPGPARVVNISSGLGALTDMQNSCTAYGLSKTALNAVTRQFATAYKEDKILVNSVCPGWCRTEMGGKDAPRSPEEGTASILYTALDVTTTGGFYRDSQSIAW